MRTLFLLLLAALALPAFGRGPIDATRVVVLYNSNVENSGILAKDYAKARGIPAGQVVGLAMRSEDTISREFYDQQIRVPLRKIFTDKGWWKLGKDSEGLERPVRRTIDVLVTMKGVPFRISRVAPEKDPNHAKAAAQFNTANEASVDSELAYLGIEGLPIGGPLQNAYFKKDAPFAQAGLNHMILVGRIDGPTWKDCVRMIKDAITVEKRGLWGRCYLDQSGRHPLGDQWLSTIEARNVGLGISTVMDKNKDTYPTAYPMTDAALYYGWYTYDRDGPLLDPNFRFRQGAIAVHLHSFSAEKLRNPDERWVGPIIAAGAAGTLGNTWEPYLQMTHHFDIFHEALTRGYTLVEAAYQSIPVVSWQGVVIGDPLYRPFSHLQSASGPVTDEDRSFRLLRAATIQTTTKPSLRKTLVERAAEQKKIGVLYEDLGLSARRTGLPQDAASYFALARAAYGESTADALRCDIHQVDMAREAGNIGTARAILTSMKGRYQDLSAVATISALTTILDPPAPEPAQP